MDNKRWSEEEGGKWDEESKRVREGEWLRFKITFFFDDRNDSLFDKLIEN